MAETEYSIDFYKIFRLEKPISGLVRRITSPKGIRSAEGESYSYKFHTELCGIYTGEPMNLVPGLYQVLDVCRPYDQVVWNQYIFHVDQDGFVYPIAEFLELCDSSWIKKAIPTIKKVFAGELVESIELTKYKHDDEKSKGWITSKNKA